MELSSSKIKNFLCFRKQNFCKKISYISGKIFPSSKNKKKTLLKKFLYFLIFWQVELFSSNIKKFFIFSQEKPFLIFRETETPKKFLIFQETKFTYISGNRNPKKPLIFQEVTFRARKIKKLTLKKCLIFRKMELSSHVLKKLLISKERTYKAGKSKNFYIFFHIFCLLRENFSNIGAKKPPFLIFSL